MRVRVLGVVFASFAVSVCAASSLSDEDLARQFYPDQLMTEAAKVGSELRQWGSIRVDLDRSGHDDYLAVAYGNGISGALRVIKTTGDAPRVVAEPHVPALLGLNPQITAVDVDADGVPELLVSYRSARSHRTYDVFAWRSGAAVPIGDSFIDADLIDLNGDGKLEVVAPTDTHGEQTGSGTNNSYEIFSLQDGVFAKMSWQVPFFHTFSRQTAKPFIVDRTFPASAGTYTLRVTNGISGKAAVDSGVVTLNGKVVLGPDDFKTKRTLISVPVDLLDRNRLSVEIRSAPGSALTLFLSNQ